MEILLFLLVFHLLLLEPFTTVSVESASNHAFRNIVLHLHHLLLLLFPLNFDCNRLNTDGAIIINEQKSCSDLEFDGARFTVLGCLENIFFILFQ